jgi:pilus assembly protein CpaF
MAGLGLPHAAIREQVADAIDLVVCQARGSDGARRVVGVSEVVRVAGGAGVRELYALRSGRPCWRAPLGDTLAGRLAAGAADSSAPLRAAAAARPEARVTTATGPGSPERGP